VLRRSEIDRQINVLLASASLGSLLEHASHIRFVSGHDFSRAEEGRKKGF